MKKIITILIIIVFISSPVSAISLSDIIESIKEIFIGIKGVPTQQFDMRICTEGGTRCGIENECNGNPCVMVCQNNQWIEFSYCANQCENGECINPTGGNDTIILPTICTEGGTRCGIENECNGNPCVMVCQNNQWIEFSYCANQCENGECIEALTQQCLDGTPYNQCSNNKPYFCSNGNLIQNCNTCGCSTRKECINNKCVENEPYDPGGREEDNPNLLNIPPTVYSIEDKIIKVGESLRFEIRAIDQNRDSLNFYFNNKQNKITTRMVECSIQENIVNCKAIKDGEETLEIIVSDGKDETIIRFKIKVLKKLYEPKKGVVAGLVNTPPVADAGLDITGTPGIPIILDASLSFDKEGLPSRPETFKWYENNNLIARGKIVEKIFSLGKHQITLEVIDTEELTDTDTITVTIEQRTTCKNTQTKYYPKDTLCNNIWPVKDGPEFKINSLTEGACSLFEVCSEELDYIIDDSIKCCTGRLTDPEKTQACNFANENSERIFENCKALYIIKSLGRSAIYMKEYFDAEMCCKGVEVLCPSKSYLYTANPLPNWLKEKGLQCPNTPDNNPHGVWRTDTKLGLNSIALSDVPAHVSLNILKTGTCVDYSVAATTLLRKAGFSTKEAITVEAPDHAYNLFKFKTYNKYLIFDMTGNNEGIKIGKVPSGYNYCENIVNCYNDLGPITCPKNEEIFGCENLKERTGRIAKRQIEGVKGTLQSFWKRILNEILR